MHATATFWLLAAGVTALTAGAVTLGQLWTSTSKQASPADFGRIFVAAPLAVFGTEHLVSAHAIMQIVPGWMPLRLFWAYFVGFALIAAAISLLVNKLTRLTATLLAIMFFLFVLLIHLPNLAVNLGDRFRWAVAFRDIAFGGGALVYAIDLIRDGRGAYASRLRLVGQLCVAIPLVFFGVENVLHPQFAPGVPLEKLTPSWVLFPTAWAYIAGIIMLISGVGLLLNKYSRLAAVSAGALMAVLTLLLYAPILARAVGTSQIIEGLNYVADTLLFGGTILLVAPAYEDLDHTIEPSRSVKAFVSE